MSKPGQDVSKPSASASCCEASLSFDGTSDPFSLHYIKAKKGKRSKASGDYDLQDHYATSPTTKKIALSFPVSVLEGMAGPGGTSHTIHPTFAAQEQEDEDEMEAWDEEEDMAVPTSQFSDRLCTNYIPSLPEISEIHQYVSLVDSKLAQYDAQIARLSAVLQDLAAKRTQLQDTRTAHRAFASPFRRLPPEILQVIFAWCLPPTRNCVMHASEAPVLLGRVCSEWRRIALATPELWASLHVVPPNVSYTNPAASKSRFRRKRELMEMWLARSGACALSVSMVWFAGDSDEEAALCGMLLEVLAPLCARWKVLDFQVPLKMFKPFTGLRAADVPLLEGLTLMDNRTPSDLDIVDRWPESLNFAENAQRLRTFVLTFFSGGMRLPALPWPQLTTLYLESNIAFFFADAREMLATLALCASLVSCTLKFPLSHTAALPAYEPLDPDTTVVLPRLEALCVDGDQHLANTFHMSNTLASICAPRLRTLDVLGRAGRPESVAVPEPFAALRTLLRKSGSPPLEKLNLESMTVVPEEFVACLRMVPTLKELVVQNWTARVFATPVASAEEDERETELADVAENKILLALTVSSSKGEQQARQASTPEVSDIKADGDGEEAGTRDGTTPASEQEDASPLCPNLQRIDFTMCDASQRLLCDFVASRWENPPPGVARLQAVKSNFMALEEDAVKARMERFMVEGLQVSLTYQMPVTDDYSPSPWTGLEGAPGP
ncbi:hypothetical protein CVT25_015299 [Psilocybe cyanescens]|uniref:Uncharacterized protein n=1 Tax=Psilocybe cyanescens TaxID=93625 RepID=A0A409WH01_PSICY|nr:hypothetical protein CVT25_015299 [Psilocybe cyanescens]